MTSRTRIIDLIKSKKVILRLTSLSKSAALQEMYKVRKYRKSLEKIYSHLEIENFQLKPLTINSLDSKHKYSIWWLGYSKGLCGSCRSRNTESLDYLISTINNLGCNYNLSIYGKQTWRSINKKNAHKNKYELLDLDKLIANSLDICSALELDLNHKFIVATSPNKKDNNRIPSKVKFVQIPDIKDYQHSVKIAFMIANEFLSLYSYEVNKRIILMDSATKFCEDSIDAHKRELHTITKEQITNDLNILSNLVN